MRLIPPQVVAMILMWPLALAGCAPITWVRVTLNRPLSEKDVNFIEPGTTTWDQVIAHLGAPSGLSETPRGLRATYDYYDARRFDVDFGTLAGYFLPPGASEAPHQFDFTNSGAGTNTFQVTFDSSHGIVEYAGFSRDISAAQFKTSPFQSHSP